MKKIGNWVMALLVLVQLALALGTIHITEYKQGVGLYLAIQSGSDNRLFMDIVVCICAMILLILILAMPCIMLKYRSLEAIFRFFSVFFAFMPVLSLSMLIHLFDGHNLLTIVYDTDRALTLLSSYLRVVVPLMIFLYVMYHGDELPLKKWHKVTLVIQVPAMIAMVILPELSDVLWFLSFYSLAVVAFDWWEQVYALNKGIGGKVLMWLFTLLMYLRGSTRMINMVVYYVTKVV